MNLKYESMFFVSLGKLPSLLFLFYKVYLDIHFPVFLCILSRHLKSEAVSQNYKAK